MTEMAAAANCDKCQPNSGAGAVKAADCRDPMTKQMIMPDNER